MHANGRQLGARQRARDSATLHYERHRPEQTTLYRQVQQHATTFFAHTEACTGSELPRFVKDEFDAFLECGIVAHGFLRLRCGKCGYDKLVAFSCKRRGFCPSSGARRMSQTAAHLVDQIIPLSHVPVRQWVPSLPVPLRVHLAAQPELMTPVLQVLQRIVSQHLLTTAGLSADKGQGAAVTLIQRFGSAANLAIHLNCLVLDGVYRSGADSTPVFAEAATPSDDELQAMLHTVMARLMNLLTRWGVLDRGDVADVPGRAGCRRGRGGTPRPPQTAVATCRIAFGPRAGLKVLTIRGAIPRECTAYSTQCASIGLNCGSGELKIIAAILEQPVIEQILAHLELDPQPPPRGWAREARQD